MAPLASTVVESVDGDRVEQRRSRLGELSLQLDALVVALERVVQGVQRAGVHQYTRWRRPRVSPRCSVTAVDV